MRAYVDESVREQSPGYYVLAAVVVNDDGIDAVRSTLRGLLMPGAQRLHWHDEREDARASLVKAVGSLDLPALAVVSTPMRRSRQERARALCLTRLLWELAQLDVPAVTVESRQNRDRHDASTIGAARRAGRAHTALRFDHQRPRDEPLLWLPDLVAGAVAVAYAGQAEYLAPLGPRITVIEVEPPG